MTEKLFTGTLNHNQNKTNKTKSHHLQAGVTALSVPPPFLSAVHEKKKLFVVCIRALTVSSGRHVPLRPPLGPALGLAIFFCRLIERLYCKIWRGISKVFFLNLPNKPITIQFPTKLLNYFRSRPSQKDQFVNGRV